jgi:trypsin
VGLLLLLSWAAPALAQSRIVGGERAPVGAYPWVAALVKPPLIEGSDIYAAQFCGGALIAPNWVVTAAHCVFEAGGAIASEELAVSVGAYQLSDAPTPIPVTRIYIHPDFNPFSLSDDLALLYLSQAAVESPLGLVTSAESALTAPGSAALAMGWGLLTEDGTFPDTLQQVELEIVDDWTCALALGEDVVQAGAGSLCAGYPDGGRDTCQGDSGGPLLVQEAGGGWLLAGITSFGLGCARTLSPGVYAEIQNYSDTGAWLNACLADDCTGWSELVCPDGSRHSPNTMCNGIDDCPSGVDESVDYCPFFCGVGESIPWERWCDGVRDCSLGQDESPAECGAWGCVEGPTIARYRVCDGDDDCDNAGDENPDLCSAEFRCDSAESVPLYWACDGWDDCLNGADEDLCQNQVFVRPARSSECEGADGFTIDSGIDLNRSGALESYEVQERHSVCSDPGALADSGAAGPAQLVNVTELKQGEECPNGGVLVQSGEDLDADGILDPAEVSQDSTLCVQVVASLVKLLPVESEDCAVGGVVVVSGADLDGDGELATDEIADRQVLCVGGEASPSELDAGGADAGAGLPRDQTAADAGGRSLLLVEEEADLDGCPNGGLLVRSGTDLDGDQRLEGDEVRQESVLCQPRDGRDGNCGCIAVGRVEPRQPPTGDPGKRRPGPWLGGVFLALAAALRRARGRPPGEA